MSDERMQIELHERARLFTAVLAASDWPDREQAFAPHAVHAQAKRLRRYLQPWRDHTAVQEVNRALAAGHSPSILLQTALTDFWPGLDEFAAQTNLADEYWPAQAASWDGALAALQELFQEIRLVPFLRRLPLAIQPQRFVLMPNLLYPALTPLPLELGADWYLLLPPPRAVGASPPWSYDEDPGWVVGMVCAAFAHRLLGAQTPPFADTAVRALTHAFTTLCLEQELDEMEGRAYLLRIKKAAGLPDLPALTERLRAFLEQPEGDLRRILD